MSRPLTRREWDEFRAAGAAAESWGLTPPDSFLARIEATIEHDFAPEPFITERTLFDWLYGTDMHDRTHFQGGDLYTAWARARTMHHPPVVTLTGYAIGVTARDKARIVRNAASAARILAALAYAEAHDATDVSHLLGDAT